MTTPEITQADRELVHAMIRQLPLAAKMALSTQPSGLYELAALHRTQARDAALEESAKVAEGMLKLDSEGYDLTGFTGPNGYLRSAATAIRSLKTSTTNTTGEGE